MKIAPETCLYRPTTLKCYCRERYIYCVRPNRVLFSFCCQSVKIVIYYVQQLMLHRVKVLSTRKGIHWLVFLLLILKKCIILNLIPLVLDRVCRVVMYQIGYFLFPIYFGIDAFHTIILKYICYLCECKIFFGLLQSIWNLNGAFPLLSDWKIHYSVKCFSVIFRIL